MTIRFKFRGNVYELDIGYTTPWFGQLYFVSFSQLWFDNMEVSYAEMIWHSKKERNQQGRKIWNEISF